jgi:hypothetical protein
LFELFKGGTSELSRQVFAADVEFFTMMQNATSFAPFRTAVALGDETRRKIMNMVARLQFLYAYQFIKALYSIASTQDTSSETKVNVDFQTFMINCILSDTFGSQGSLSTMTALADLQQKFTPERMKLLDSFYAEFMSKKLVPTITQLVQQQIFPGIWSVMPSLRSSTVAFLFCLVSALYSKTTTAASSSPAMWNSLYSTLSNVSGFEELIKNDTVNKKQKELISLNLILLFPILPKFMITQK